MARIAFDVLHRFDQSSEVVWTELVDWKAHEHWIPMTRVKVGSGAPTDVGHEFTAWTGLGPFSLEDRMRVSRCEWDQAAASGDCEVEKLGPVLRGIAGFTVVPDGDGALLTWVEDVQIKFVPGFLAPVIAKIGAAGFKQGMKGLAKNLAKQG